MRGPAESLLYCEVKLSISMFFTTLFLKPLWFGLVWFFNTTCSLSSTGHHVCLGKQMAQVELFIFFTNLLQAFTFQLPKGVKEINLDYVLGAILQPHPHKPCAIPR